METWKLVSAELNAQKKSKEWLAKELGIERIQTVDHWKNRGIPSKYHFEIENKLRKPHGWIIGQDLKPNQPLAHTPQAQAATNDVAIDTALKALSLSLEQADPSLRDGLAGLLSSLAKAPSNPDLMDALTRMLSPTAFVQDRRKRA